MTHNGNPSHYNKPQRNNDALTEATKIPPLCDLLSILWVYLFEVIVDAHIFLCEEGHSYTSLSSSSCATNAMCVVLNVLGHVIVDHI